ncbi:CPBP family intramembrane glutamic endopeptidase [Neptunicella marina]|uniref:CPBP family intramembrane metalloprotease n=1 Tax=Neptunicella marina TaxID=2125989 RepID=A0A8J6M0G3_9ALTE|nr:CPBP family intramembrane glutamic endopeptidase [Neptunicella marina]MBC3764827.1 CPBP family intramembrane metalloprotease [Neptunicella marina]
MEKHQIIVSKVAVFWGVLTLYLHFSGLILLPVAAEYRDLVTSLITIVLLLLLTCWLTHKRERGMRSIGLSWPANAPKALISGSLLGALISACILAIMTLLTPISVNWADNIDYANAIGYSALILMALSVMEEIAFRALPLFYLQNVFGTRIAIYSTSVAFAFYHGLDPMNLLGPGVWGIFFAIMVLHYNNLVMATGLHFGLNWVQSFFSLKTGYATGIWDFNLSGQSALVATNTLGLFIHVMLLILAIVAVERLITNKANAT